MNYLLDTNACIALLNGKPPVVRFRFQKAIDAGEEALVPAVTAFELWYGVANSVQQQANTARVEAFFAGPVDLLPFDEDDARVAGRIRAATEATGKSIGAYDILIAAQALRHKLTLVTANVREFGRVEGLLWEDWAKT
jgi:tRNA(fMet)-specific endonuclease VapC